MSLEQDQATQEHRALDIGQRIIRLASKHHYESTGLKFIYSQDDRALAYAVGMVLTEQMEKAPPYTIQALANRTRALKTQLDALEEKLK